MVDIELLALEGIYDVSRVPADRRVAFQALREGDQVNRNDNRFSSAFPYIAAPNTDAVNQEDGSSSSDGAAAAPAGGTFGGTVLPAVTGTLAALLIGVGGVSLFRSRASAGRGTVGAET